MVMLHESSSSFDSVHSYGMIVAGEESSLNHQDQDGIVSDDEDEHLGTASETSSIGIMILPPANSDVDADFLSVPSTVPSDLNSIHIHFPNPMLIVHPYDLVSGEETDEEPDLMEDSGSVRRRAYAPAPGHNQYPRLNLLILLVTVVAAFSVSVTLYLVWESRQLKEQVRDLQAIEQAYMLNLRESTITLAKEQEEKTKQLEDQLRQLKNRENTITLAKEQEEKTKQLEEQLRQLKNREDAIALAKEQEEKTKLLEEQALRLKKETAAASARKEQEEKTKLLEEQVLRLKKEAAAAASARKDKQTKNPKPVKKAKEEAYAFPWEYEHAQAKMKLAECSREASKTVKKKLQTFGKSVSHAHERIWEQLRDDYQDMKEWYHGQQDESSSGEQARSFVNKPPQKNDNVDLKTVTKSILSTAALGAAAAILVTAADTFWKSEDD